MGDKDFFLSPDDSQTMGDIDYMRKAKRTRRTFPKTLKNPNGFALENEVSSTEDRSGMYKGNNNGQDISQNTVFNPTPSSQSQPGATGGSAVTQTQFNPQAASTSSSMSADVSAPKPSPAPAPSPEERRQTDTSMDMFRNMAKNIRR